MLDVAIEKVLTQVLDPYLDGIHVGSLRNGIFKGHLELTGLSLKPEVLALAGLEGYRIREGKVQLIRVCLPWNSLATGKVAVVVSGVHMAVEQVPDGRSPEEIVASMREMKGKAVEIRAAQVRDLMEQRRKAAQSMEGEEEGFGMKLARRFINNVTIEISDVQVSFASSILGVAAGAKLPQLRVLSTDEDFEEPEDGRTVSITGAAMYKVVHVRGFDVQLFTGSGCGLGSLEDAPRIFGPLDTRLNLAHVPEKQLIQVGLHVGGNKVTLARSHLKHLLGVPPILDAELTRTRAQLIAPKREKAILADTSGSKEEYGRLYSRRLLHERFACSEHPPLTSKEEERLQLLEDALPVQLLAAQRCSAEDAVEEAAASGPGGEAEGFFASLLRKYACCHCTGENARSSVRFEALRDAAQFESIEAPQRVSLDIILGEGNFHLVDDRGVDHESRQVVSLTLCKMGIGFQLATGVDHRGTKSVAFRLEGCLDGISAHHAGKGIIKVCAPTAETEFTGATKWVVEQKLEADHNLLSLSFDSSPLDISFYPAMVAQLLDFFQPAEQDAPFSAEAVVESADTAEDLALQWLERADTVQAQELVDAVYDRVPDEIFLQLNLCGPTVHLPVRGLGTVDASLGQLRLATPTPGALSKIKLVAELSNASLRTVSSAGECIDVIKPFPVRVSLEQVETSDLVKVGAEVSMGRLELCAAPQALQILAAAPAVLDDLQPPQEAQPAQVAQAAEAQRPATSGDPAQMLSEEKLAKVSKFAKEVGEQSAALDSAAKRAKEVAGKQLCVDLAAQIAGVGVTVTDCVVPVAKLQLKFLEPGISAHAEMSMSGVLDHAHLDVQNAELDAEVLNPQNGAWEPMLEPFHFGADVEVAAAGQDDDLATRVACRSQTPLLVNAALPAVQRLNGLAPLVASMLVPPPQGDGDRDKVPGRYRVVNLFDEELELVLTSSSASQVTSRIKPAGSDWTSMDELIFPTSAKTVAVRLPGGQSSMPLRLDQGGVVCVPGSQATAELLAPEASCRLLLLGTPLRIHNQTDIPLEVRFHSERHEVIPYGLPQAVACNASWVGFPLPSYVVDDHLRLMQDSQEQAVEAGSLLLQPNTICTVPCAALQSSEKGLFARVSTRPVGLDMEFSAEAEVGGAEGLLTLSCAAGESGRPRTLLGSDWHLLRETSGRKLVGCLGSCGSKVGQPGRLSGPSCSHAHLACECQRRSIVGPRAELCLATVALKPAMSLLNALPVGSLSLGYTAGRVDASSRASWREVQVRSMSCLNLYQFPVGALSQGISVRARLDTRAPWSQAVYFGAEALETAGTTRSLDVRQIKDGAAAGLDIESLGSLRLRLHCPNYFIHRLGLGNDLQLALHHKGAPLPQAKQVTLLPSHVGDGTCELVLARGGWRASHGLPLEGSFSMSTKRGPWVLCAQVEDVAPSSLLGARSRVVTLKAHMVLTNASAEDLELQAPGGGVVALPAGASTEHHFEGENGKALETTLRLRSARGAAGQWSLPVSCCESAAGSTPVSLPAARPGASGPEVWTVEVAPEGSAVSVSFKKGSDLVAINRATRAGVPMAVRPDSDPKSAEIVVQPGQESPIGWATPRQGSKMRPVAVEAAGVACDIEDVRRRARRVLGDKQLAVTVSRQGTRTLIVLDDIDEHAKVPEKKDVAAGSSLHVDLRLDEIGVSVVGRPSCLVWPHELFYFHLGNIRLDYQQNVTADSALVNLVISELQGACQMPDHSDDCQAGGGGNSPHDNHIRQSAGEKLAHRFNGEKRKSAVILANRGEDGAAFLCISLQQEAVSSQDLILSSANIALDKLDVSVDDYWLGALQEWVTEAFPQDELGLGVRFEQVAARAGRGLCEAYAPPPVPLVLSAEVLKLSAVNLRVWCRVPLSMLDFLPAPARGALAVLSFSGHFTLDGAGIQLPAKDIPPYSGPVDLYAIKLARSYGWGLLRVVGELLGKSSLLNVPKTPFHIAGTTVAVLTEGVGQAIGAGTNALHGLTLDAEHAAKQRQRHEDKHIGNVGDGVLSAGASLARGVEGLGDIVRKPIAGAQQDGLKGFAKGIGTGLAGTLVKPIAAIGEAASDLSTGLSSQVHQVAVESKAAKRLRGLQRCREPRLLFSESGEMRMWDEQEAEVPRQLGWDITRGVKEVVYLAVEGSSALVLLLFPQKLLLAKLSVDTDAQAEGAIPEEAAAGRLEEEFGAAFQRLPSLDKSPGVQHQRSNSIRSVISYVADAEPDVRGVVRGLQLADLRSADLEEVASGASTAAAARRLVLKDRSGAATRLSIGNGPGCSARDPWVLDTLVSGLREAAEGAPVEWTALGTALRSRALAERLTERHEASGQLLEVYEVERWYAIASKWTVPYMPIDRGLRWRWVNAKGHRHPQIEASMPKKECAAAQRPPCELRGFEPASDWEVDVHGHSDEQGWTYGLHWGGAWKAAQGSMVKGLRRRRWSRRYA